MRRSSLYGHAAELYELIAASRQPADTIVDRFTRSRRYLGAKDRRFISTLLYDILRHHARLSAIVRAALAVAAPDLPGMRISGAALCVAHAIHDEKRSPEDLAAELEGLWRTSTTDVDPFRFFAAVANVDLPLLKPPAEGVEDRVPQAERLALEHSLPVRLVEAIIDRSGACAREECAAFNRAGPISVRVNLLKAARGECIEEMRVRGIEAAPAPLAPEGVFLAKRANLTGLDLFRNGWFEPQDEGSQLLSRVLRPLPGEKVVDACAGGGGKTLHLAALMENRGSILAMDIDPIRLTNLRERAARGGVTIAATLALPAEDPPPPEWIGKADAVLVDAPCSGTGRYRRDPASKLRFDEIDVKGLARMQGSILARSAELVRPGGRLVYSTCSLLPEENEEVVARFLASHSLFRQVDALQILRLQGILLEGGPSLLLTPHRHGTDGFFAAAMVREPA